MNADERRLTVSYVETLIDRVRVHADDWTGDLCDRIERHLAYLAHEVPVEVDVVDDLYCTHCDTAHHDPEHLCPGLRLHLGESSGDPAVDAMHAELLDAARAHHSATTTPTEGTTDEDATVLGEAGGQAAADEPGDGADSHDVGDDASEVEPAPEERGAAAAVTAAPTPKPKREKKRQPPRYTDPDSPPPCPEGGRVSWDRRGFWRVTTAEAIAKIAAGSARRWGKDPAERRVESQSEVPTPTSDPVPVSTGTEPVPADDEAADWGVVEDVPELGVDLDDEDLDPEPPSIPDVDERPAGIRRTALEHEAYRTGVEHGSRKDPVPTESPYATPAASSAYMEGLADGVAARPPVVVQSIPTPSVLASVPEIPQCPNEELRGESHFRCTLFAEHAEPCHFGEPTSRIETSQVVPVPDPKASRLTLTPDQLAEAEKAWSRVAAR